MTLSKAIKTLLAQNGIKSSVRSKAGVYSSGIWIESKDESQKQDIINLVKEFENQADFIIVN